MIGPQAQSDSPTQKIDLIGGRTSQALSTTPHSCVEPMWNRIISYPLRKWMSTDDIHFGWLTLWLTFTLNPPSRHRVALFQVAFSCYAPTLNESINNRTLSPIGEPNPKDRADMYENLSNLSITPHSYIKLMFDRITGVQEFKSH